LPERAVQVGQQPLAPSRDGDDRPAPVGPVRKLAPAPDYVIGSAHAVTNAGEIIVGSGSGSQLGAYAYAGGHVILVIGHQKLVRDIDEGLRRIREYSLPGSMSGCRASAVRAACSPKR